MVNDVPFEVRELQSIRDLKQKNDRKHAKKKAFDVTAVNKKVCSFVFTNQIGQGETF